MENHKPDWNLFFRVIPEMDAGGENRRRRAASELCDSGFQTAAVEKMTGQPSYATRRIDC